MARISRHQRTLETNVFGDSENEPPLVQGLVRGFAVLRAFHAGETSLGNAEIAERANLPKATVSRLTQTLTALGYLTYMPQVGRYSIGPGIVALCHNLLADMPHRVAARPVMQELADYSHLPVSLGMRDQFDMLFIETVHRVGARPARFDLGARIPLNITTMGRAYLYGVPKQERDVLLEAIKIRSNESEWHAICAGLDSAFESIAKRGFCISFGDWRSDVYAIGAPVVDHDGTVLAINCGGPASEIDPGWLENEVGLRLAQAASQITNEDLG